ncbi:MAG: hypothetical protein FXF54_05400 [Kosmotoga sp.]|nr:MAG: hypothetical protein FXF54_05400 [Kosmotoga sp.]
MKSFLTILWLLVIVSGFCVIEKVFIIPFSHQDIGFTSTQQNVAEKYVEVYRNLIPIMNNFLEFKFTIETYWQFEQWLNNNKDMDKLSEFISLAKNGRLEFCAAYGSMHSGFSNCFILENSLKSAKKFAKKNGFDIKTCMMNDVPGFCADLPDILANHGIPYFMSGINDKYGGVLDLPYPANIFFWEGPEGKKVLTWVTKNSYMEGVLFKNVFFLLSYLEELENSGYPYNAVAVMVASDNGGYEQGVIAYLELVKDMVLPDVGIKISTPTEFMRYMENHYAESIPTYAGDWSGWWEVVKTGGPYSASLARWAQEFSSLYVKNFGYPDTKEFNRIINDLVLYTEHTASCGAGWPGNLSLSETMISNTTVVNYAKEAYNELNKIIMDKLIEVKSNKISVLNLLDERIARIMFEADKWDPDTSILISNGSNKYVCTPFTLDATDAWNPIKKGYECFVPLSNGINDFEILKTENYKRNNINESTLENDYYIVKVFSNGTFSIFDKQKGIYLGKNMGYFETSYTQNLPERKILEVDTTLNSKFDNIYRESIRVEFNESSFIESLEIVLPEKVKAISAKYIVDRNKLPYVNYNKHSINLYVCFPIEGDYLLNYSGPCSVVNEPFKFPSIRPEFIPVRDIVGLSNDNLSITVGTRQAFMFSYENEVLRFHLLRHYDEAATKDKGIAKLPVSEPGTPNKIIFDFLISSGDDIEKALVKEFITIPICSDANISEFMEGK